MKKTARMIATFQCNRNCPGCCNGHGNEVKKIEDIHELLGYEEIILTGGEPMLLGNKLIDFIRTLRELCYEGDIYLYTAYWKPITNHINIINAVDGITFTIHAEATDVDIKCLKWLSQNKRLSNFNFSSRLIVDSRCYDRYDFSNIDLTNWDVIRKLQWKDKCEPAENEDLISYLL